MWAGVRAGDVDAALEERQLVLVDMNFVVLAGRGRRVLRTVYAAGKLTLHVQRSTVAIGTNVPTWAPHLAIS